MLNLNIDNLAGPGRPAKAVEYDVVRDLTEADLAMLALPASSVPAPIKKITDRHHALARLLAAGTPEGEAAMIVGYDLSRVSILKNSPAFQDLLGLYRAEVKREFSTVIEHMAGMSRDALIELRDRFEENPAKFTNNELLKVVTELIDRSAGAERPDDMPTMIELVFPSDSRSD